MQQCPTCRARLTAHDEQCPRCRSNLSKLRRLEARATLHCRNAIQHIERDADRESAVWAVKESLRLKHDPVTLALRNFLQRKQEQIALTRLVEGELEQALKALDIALSLGESPFARVMQGFILQEL